MVSRRFRRRFRRTVTRQRKMPIGGLAVRDGRIVPSPPTSSFVSGMRMNMGRAPHYFKRVFKQNYPVTDTITHRSQAIMLALLPNYTEYSYLFDSYKILAVSVKFIYTQSGAVGQGSTTNMLPELVTCNDMDDATPLSNLTDYEQYDTFKVVRLDKPIKRYFKPKLAQVAYAGGAFTGYIRQKGSPWIDCDSPAVEHYGIKYAIKADMFGGGGMNTLGIVDVYWTYYLAFKDQR